VALSVALVGPHYQRSMLQTPLATGVAVASACCRAVDEEFALKWPNDVLVAGRKVAGILCEGVLAGGRFRGVVVGVGVNVNAGRSDFSDELVDSVASLREFAPSDLDLAEFTARLYHAIREEIAALQGDTAATLDRWRALDATAGREVRVGQAVGVADGVDSDGALRVKTSTGTLSVRSGEVEWV
jgi:BirA family biotin operon repressor/biotin-[acetyl-CoA-carboxylase] ligase